MSVHAGRLFLGKKKNLLYLLISHVKLCHTCVFFPLVTLMTGSNFRILDPFQLLNLVTAEIFACSCG